MRKSVSDLAKIGFSFASTQSSSVITVGSISSRSKNVVGPEKSSHAAPVDRVLIYFLFAGREKESPNLRLRFLSKSVRFAISTALEGAICSAVRRLPVRLGTTSPFEFKHHCVISFPSFLAGPRTLPSMSLRDGKQAAEESS